MVKQAAKKFTGQELLFLRLEGEEAFRFRCCISSQTLDRWCMLGLPYHSILSRRYFDPLAVDVWLTTAREDGTGRNLDYIWAQTPVDELPRTDYVASNGRRFLLIPAEERHSRGQKDRNHMRKAPS